MADFMPGFLLCNLWISIIILILLAIRYLFKKILTNRMRYGLWYLLLGLLAVPFLQLSFLQRFFLHLPWDFPFFGIWNHVPAADSTGLAQAAGMHPSGAADWINDISLSVSSKTPSGIWLFLSCLWIAGMCIMGAALLRKLLQLHQIRRSALPLQNAAVRRIYDSCLDEMQIRRSIPVLCTVFLKSPVITGVLRPCIYLPTHLVCGHPVRQIRYMLLHELQHYRHKDTLTNHLINLASVIYWFHPLVRYALAEMRSDREIACDTSVLKMLCEDAYEDYGHTLLSLARQNLAASIPFSAGISGNMVQMKKRVLNIAGYHPPSRKQTLQGLLAFLLTAALLSGFLPLLSAYASDQEHSFFSHTDEKVEEPDLREIFGGYSGSFALYDTADNSWQIYNKDQALTRTAPASTYKIYSALLGLETGVISKKQSNIPWNRQKYTYPSWNTDQDLTSAMKNSVTWYFQALDAQIGFSQIKQYIRRIGYGNQAVTGNTDTYWINGGLKISPVEQVELLQKLYNNTFGFSQDHIHLVKQTICLETTENGTLYGKTGTVGADGKNISGWLVGFVEKEDRNCFFALNIQKEDDADGPTAARIALEVLEKLGMWR